MKKEINPSMMIGAVVVVVGIVGYFVYQAVTGTTATVHVEEKTQMINGQKVPPGAPVDYLQNNGNASKAP